MNDSRNPMTFGARDLIRDWDTAFRYTSVLGLQMGQILPQSFIAIFLPVMFREQGLPLEMYWVFTLPAIPTWFRPLWAPLVDRTGSTIIGMRKSWFIPCTAFGALAYLSLAWFAPTLDNLTIIIALLVVKTTFMTTQDIAIDGYMVENIRDEERPVAAAVLDIGRNVSRFTAWAAIPWVYSHYGWEAAMVTASGLMVAFSLPGIIRPEPPRPMHYARSRPSLKRLISRAESCYIYPLCFVISLMTGLIASLWPTYLSDLGFSLGRIAVMIAPAILIGALIGAGATSWFLRRFGYKSTMLMAAVCIMVTVIPIMWLGSLEAPSFLVVFLVTLNGLALPSFLDITFQAARLKWASKSQAATDYTTQIVTMMAGMSLSTAIGGWLAAQLGWFYYFLLAGTLISGTCFLLYAVYDRVEALVDKREAEELGQTPPEPNNPDIGDTHAATRAL